MVAVNMCALIPLYRMPVLAMVDTSWTWIIKDALVRKEHSIKQNMYIYYYIYSFLNGSLI